MKLLTHNMLTSHVKGVKNGYPLRVLAKQVVVNTVNFNAEFVARMLPKLDWGVLKATAQSVSIPTYVLFLTQPDTWRSAEQ